MAKPETAQQRKPPKPLVATWPLPSGIDPRHLSATSEFAEGDVTTVMGVDLKLSATKLTIEWSVASGYKPQKERMNWTASCQESGSVSATSIDVVFELAQAAVAAARSRTTCTVERMLSAALEANP